MSPLYPGGPTLPEERRLVTAVPGRRSGELSAAVARGASTMFPVLVSQAGGDVLVDVDGNSLIDFGSGNSSARARATAAPKLETADGYLPVVRDRARCGVAARLRRAAKCPGRPERRGSMTGMPLHGISDLRKFSRTSQTPIYLVSMRAQLRVRRSPPGNSRPVGPLAFKMT